MPRRSDLSEPTALRDRRGRGEGPAFEERGARAEGLRARSTPSWVTTPGPGPRSIWSYVYPMVPSTLALGDRGDGRAVDPGCAWSSSQCVHRSTCPPSTTFDLGVAQIAFVDTDYLDARPRPRPSLRPGLWLKLLMGHHVLKTFYDKEREDYVAPWLQTLKAQPTLREWARPCVVLKVYGGVAAVTSGSASKLRHRRACPPDCGEGQLFGASTAGYAVLEVEPKRLSVIFKDDVGNERYRWSQTR